MNMTDVLNFLRIINAISAFTITVFSLKKSNENPVFKPIAYLTAMLGFWNLIRFFLLQTKELPLSFIMMRSIYTCIAFSALFLFYYAQAYCIPNFKLLYRHLMTVIPVITCILSITANRHSFFINLNPYFTVIMINFSNMKLRQTITIVQANISAVSKYILDLYNLFPIEPSGSARISAAIPAFHALPQAVVSEDIK